jgi:hypothetical protein
LSLTKDYQNLFWTMSFQNQLIETLRKQVDKEDRNEGF